jgi:hypothetical protein
MWSDYFLDFLPTDNEPELLKLLTMHPERGDITGWADFSLGYDPKQMPAGIDSDKAYVMMHEEIFRVADELGIIGSNLSAVEKAKRINDYWYSSQRNGSVIFGFGVNCMVDASGFMSLFRLAEIPAISIGTTEADKAHMENVYYLNGVWWHTNGKTFTEYFSNIDTHFVEHILAGNSRTYTTDEMLSQGIEDINESWIYADAEHFMWKLLQRPMAYPNRTLARGEVAKTICNYIGVVPMRNEQVFTDVPTTHQYSRYIWVLQKLGIMSGDGNGGFRPNDTLSMQECAAVAYKLIEGGIKEATIKRETWYDNYSSPEILTPEDIMYFNEKYKKALEAFNPPQGSNPKVFADADKIAAWAKPVIDEFSKFGILEGDNNGNLDPTGQLSKTRFLVFMYKLNNKTDMFFQDGFGGVPLF